MKTIVFVQLPLLDHDYGYLMGNVPYASASIEGFLSRHMPGLCVIKRLPFEVVNTGSNRIIASRIVDLQPDIVAFTCHLWNVERSMRVAAEVKNRLPTTTVIMGGVEINDGSIALKTRREEADLFVVGEGEWFFSRFLSGMEMGRYIRLAAGNRVAVQPFDELIPAESIVEPLTSSLLNPMPDGSTFLELSRGCPYACAYCYYSKNYRQVREISEETLYHALTRIAPERGVSEMYILSPAFNRAARFKDICSTLAGIRHGVKLHAELRAGEIDAAEAQLLYQAGFRSLEVGLQTLSRDVLRRVGRITDPERELRGMRCLRDAGIEISIGIIPGLPGETSASFMTTVERLIALEFGDGIELYPLMLLPGTALRDAAVREGIEFSDKPPYYYHHGWGISFDEMRSITAATEEATGRSHVVVRLPDFVSDPHARICGGVRFDGDTVSNWDIRRYIEIVDTAVWTCHVSLTKPAAAVAGMNRLAAAADNDTLISVVVYADEYLEEERILDAVARHQKDCLMGRIYVFHDWTAGLNVRMFQVFERYQRYAEAMRRYEWILPILKITRHTVESLERMSGDTDRILVTRGVLEQAWKEIRRFTGSPESIAFEDSEDERRYYAGTGELPSRPCAFFIADLRSTRASL